MEKIDNTLSIDELRTVFRYEPETGELFWLIDSRKAKPGRVAGTLSYGYWQVKHKGNHYLVHRIAFALSYGRWPDQVDHINTNRSDNRLANLREASVAENNRNKGKQRNNSSGYKGVSLYKPSGKFTAKIRARNVNYSLGYFDTAEEAGIAYMNAAKELHNDFARF